MYRLVLLLSLAMVLLVPSAQALEMFTNFHNGENIGFPPMEVPVAIYGHGGWHGKEMVRPVRVQSPIESVPAMTPTGCLSSDNMSKSHQTQYTANQPRVDNPAPADNKVQYISDRRHSSGRSTVASPVGYNQPVSDYDSPQSPTPAKVAPKSDGWTRSLEQAPADDPSTKRPTSVYAHPGSAPQSESATKVKATTSQTNGQTVGPTTDQRSQPPPGTSSRRTGAELPSVVPPKNLD